MEYKEQIIAEYGDFIKGNRYLSQEEMTHNATIILAYLLLKEWTVYSICALLGNMQSESTINPGIWQSLNEGSGGFGLVQWTPSTNFTVWADGNGYAHDDGFAQLKWIDEVTKSVGQWIPTDDYNITFDEFRYDLNPDIGWLASAFLKNFERAGVEVEEERRANALAWYEWFETGEPIDPPTPPPTTKPKSMSKLLLWAIATDII